MKSINAIQDEIIENFSLFGDDKESRLFYLMELGSRLAPMPGEHKTDDYIVKGCQSKVWLYPGIEDGRIIFEADSNTDITKGMISLLVSVWNGRTPQEILQTDLYFIDRIGMHTMVSQQRSNGFASMIKQMKMYALAYTAEKN
jgi:cysteine desulfuration protein SufE